MHAAVPDDLFTFHPVNRQVIAVHFHFSGDPLIAVIGLAGRLDDVILAQLALINRMSTRRYQIGGVALIGAVATEQLHLHAGGVALVDCHFIRGLGVIHDAVVANGPLWRTGDLFAHKAVFHLDAVVGEGLLVKNVAPATVQFIVLVITDHDLAVLQAEGVQGVFARRRAGNLDDPVIQILAVEQVDPFFPVGLIGGVGLAVTAGHDRSGQSDTEQRLGPAHWGVPRVFMIYRTGWE